MMFESKSLTTPLSKERIRKLKVGDIVYLSGEIFTARDKAHVKALAEKKFPIKTKDGVLFHAGPIVKKTHDRWRIVAIGPTTSARFEHLEGKFIDLFGISAIIGKGGMSKEVVEKMRDKCIYLAATGGCAALLAKAVKKVINVYWLSLGIPEAVWHLEVENFGPLIVAIDARGNSLYK